MLLASTVMNANEVDSIICIQPESDYLKAADAFVIDSTMLESEIVVSDDAMTMLMTAPIDAIALGSEERSYIASCDTFYCDVIYGDTCRVIQADSAYLEIDVAPNFKYQLVLLKKDLMMLVTTHALPQQDSEMAFYDFKWNKLPLKKYFKTPLLSDWLTDEGKKNRATLEKTLPFLLVKYYYDVDTNVLTLTNNLHTYFIASDWAKISPYMKNELKYKWNGKKFSKIK